MPTCESHIAEAVSRIEMSAIKAMAYRSAQVEGAASLTWGLPSFKTPAPIRAAVAQRLSEDPDVGKYTLPDGLPELREAVVRTHRAATGIEVDPDRHVLVTCGNMQGLNTLFHTLLDPGDEVIVTDPGFASHIPQIRMCNGVPVPWALEEARGWRLDLAALPGLLTPRTRAILLVSPSNPTGRIFEAATLRRIGTLARERGLMLLIDDPYHFFTYENRERYFNVASVPELQDCVAYLFSFSKAHAMSGWRIGYMVVPEALKREALKVHDATIICAPRISQLAALSALTGEQAHIAAFESILGRRRTLICERLDAVPHVFDYVRPEGAYYVFPRILVEHENSLQFAVDLLEQARVTVTPGSAFGPHGEHHVRMAFCVDEDAIDLAFDRIETHFGG